MNLQKYIETTFLDSAISYYEKAKNGKYTNINRAFLHEFRLTSSNEVIGQNDIELWNGQAPSFHINDQKVMLSKKPNIYIEDMIFNHTKQLYLSCKSPLYSRMGKIIGVFGVSFIFNDKLFNNFPMHAMESLKLFQESSNNRLSPALHNIKLSNRHKECLHFLARGMTIKEIAKVINLTPKTVENYLGALKIKLNCFTRAELVEKAFEFGLI